MSLSDALDLYFFRRKMEKMRCVKGEMDGEVFFSAKVDIFPCIDDMIKVLFRYLYLDLACKQFCFPPRKDIYRNESTLSIGQLVAFW